MNGLFRIALLLALGSVVITAAGLVIAPQLGDLATASKGSGGDIILDDLSVRSYVYASDGTLLATLRDEENRAPVELDDLPQHLVDAVLAVEDADFFTHDGVNARATVRALLSNVESGEIEQGGSTITQQLVKQSLLSSDQDFTRKTKEAFLAVRLEKQMSKRQILQRYLNTIYLGNHSYGIQAAAETYFGVEATDLDLAQAALLAGIIRDPIDYNPFADADVALERRRIALRRMVEEGHITEAEEAAANEVPLPTTPTEYNPPPDDYFVEEVKQRLLDDPRLGETRSERTANVFKGGLEIHTTLDLKAQFFAQVSRDEVLAPFALEGEPALFRAGVDLVGAEQPGTVGMASVEPSTGAVRALVGGSGFDDYKYNLATQGFRQPGSAFKTFVLLSLLEQGYSPTDQVSGSGPCRFEFGLPDGPYEVENFGNSRGFVGSITSMTTNSSNCGYVRLGQIAGMDNVVRLAGELGVKTRNDKNEVVPLDPAIASTPLGTQGVTPLAMASAYAAIANDGFFHEPYFIQKVLDRRGDTVFEHVPEGRRVFSIETAQIAADILKQNVLGGTGGSARVAGHDIGGKTGTAQNFSNAWFVGFSKHLATSVWMGAMSGNVEMRSVGGRNVTGGSYPAEIFGRYMGAIHQNVEPVPFAPAPRRPGGQFLRLDRSIDLTGGSYSSRSSSYSRPRSRSSSSSGSGRTRTTSSPTTSGSSETTSAPTTAAPTTAAPTTAAPTTAAPTTAPPPEDDVGD